MQVHLFLSENGKYRTIDVPVNMARQLIEERIGKSELGRIEAYAQPIDQPAFIPGSVVVDREAKTVHIYGNRLRADHLDTCWKVIQEKVTLKNF